MSRHNWTWGREKFSGDKLVCKQIFKTIKQLQKQPSKQTNRQTNKPTNKPRGGIQRRMRRHSWTWGREKCSGEFASRLSSAQALAGVAPPASSPMSSPSWWSWSSSLPYSLSSSSPYADNQCQVCSNPACSSSQSPHSGNRLVPGMICQVKYCHLACR